jgi:hypothetical protein
VRLRARPHLLQECLEDVCDLVVVHEQRTFNGNAAMVEEDFAACLGWHWSIPDRLVQFRCKLRGSLDDMIERMLTAVVVYPRNNTVGIRM